jgi:hypothetical protein
VPQPGTAWHSLWLAQMRVFKLTNLRQVTDYGFDNYYTFNQTTCRDWFLSWNNNTSFKDHVTSQKEQEVISLA